MNQLQSPDSQDEINIIFPSVILGSLYLFLLWLVARYMPALPDPVATHFSFSGEPNGWMSRQGFLLFATLFTAGIIILLSGVGYLTRYLPHTLVNIPNREFWLHADRRRQADRMLFRQMLWLCCLLTAFMTALIFVVIRANLHQPVRLSNQDSIPLMAAFLAAFVVWFIVLYRQFRVP
jgi:uncharacterized membrane protein